MSGRGKAIVIGLAIVGFGLVLILAGLGYHVTTCFDSSCTTDPTNLATALVFLASGVLGVALGGRKLWSSR
jgi:hypothetical protein